MLYILILQNKEKKRLSKTIISTEKVGWKKRRKNGIEVLYAILWHDAGQWNVISCITDKIKVSASFK
nr:hypothetical transcript [Hymenolepis microstoma]